MRTLTALCALALAGFAAPAFAAPAAPASATKFMEAAKAGKPLFVTFDTSMGKITAELDSKKAPIAVENFVGLAMGEKEWTSPTGEKLKKPYYDGLIFHRVRENFMIQGGDPLGNGTGGPGFSIADDFPNQQGMHFAKGTLGMARTMQPNSGGSQFFITVADTGFLDGQYTIFGKVLSGQDVADKISLVPKTGELPNTPVVMKKVTITDKAPAGGGKKK